MTNVAEESAYAEVPSPTAQSPDTSWSPFLSGWMRDEEEDEHPTLTDSVVVALPTTDQAPSAEETKPFETDDTTPVMDFSDVRLPDFLEYRLPILSPLSPWSSPLPQIPSPPLPSLPSPSLPLSPPSPVLSPAPPPSPIRSLTYRNCTSSGIPPPLPISVPTSSPPLLLPSASRREDRPEVTLPPRKRLGIALGPRYEVGESSSAAAARPTGGLRADYGFIRRERDRRAHAYTRHLMETEARLSREAWRRSMDASDLARGEVMSLRTTVLGQMSEIRELHAADRRRQAMTSEMLKADHRRSAEMRELRTADRTRQQQLIQTLTVMQSLQGQVTTLQGQVTALQGQVTALQDYQRIPLVLYFLVIEENGTKTSSSSMMQTGMAMTAILREWVAEGLNALLESALRWWNYHVMTVSHDVAYAMTWADLRKKMTDKYCPRNEMKNLEAELWNLKVKGTDVIGYEEYK
ncbi:hypothetical protein Tco_0647856 [Tanacetum coccineum]